MQKSRLIFFATILTGLIGFDSFGQDKPPAKPPAAAPTPIPCPKLVLKNPNPQYFREGATVTLMLEMTGGDPNVTPTIIWSVSAGLITAGQGGRRVEVDSSGAGAAGQLVAEVWVGGYAPECSPKATTTVRVVGPAMLLEKFGQMPVEDEIRY